MEIVAGLPLRYLRLETATTPLNATQLIIFEQNKGHSADVPISVEGIKAFIKPQIARHKPLRQRLIESPFRLANPVWIDDPHMDVNYHVHEIEVSTDDQDFYAQCMVHAARLGAQSLDRGSPLWKLYYLIGNQKEVAFICVSHRAMLCRLQKPIYEALFPVNCEINEHQIMESHAITCPKTGTKFGFNWLPDALPSRNDLLSLAKTDWLSIPKQAKSLGTMCFDQITRRKLAQNLVAPEDLPPHWLSAPESIFNQRHGAHRDLGVTTIPSRTARRLIRQFKNFEIRDLVLTLITQALERFLNKINHQSKQELVALIQSSALSNDNTDWTESSTLDHYQLIKLPTIHDDTTAQAQTISERRHLALEYKALLERNEGISKLPSSMLSWFIQAYNKFGVHHFHKPFCNLVISEQPCFSGANQINQFQKKSELSFPSLVPNVGLHIAYCIEKDFIVVTFTSGLKDFSVNELVESFNTCLAGWPGQVNSKQSAGF